MHGVELFTMSVLQLQWDKHCLRRGFETQNMLLLLLLLSGESPQTRQVVNYFIPILSQNMSSRSEGRSPLQHEAR